MGNSSGSICSHVETKGPHEKVDSSTLGEPSSMNENEMNQEVKQKGESGDTGVSKADESEQIFDVENPIDLEKEEKPGVIESDYTINGNLGITGEKMIHSNPSCMSLHQEKPIFLHYDHLGVENTEEILCLPENENYTSIVEISPTTEVQEEHQPCDLKSEHCTQVGDAHQSIVDKITTASTQLFRCQERSSRDPISEEKFACINEKLYPVYSRSCSIQLPDVNEVSLSIDDPLDISQLNSRSFTKVTCEVSLTSSTQTEKNEYILKNESSQTLATLKSILIDQTTEGKSELGNLQLLSDKEISFLACDEEIKSGSEKFIINKHEHAFFPSNTLDESIRKGQKNVSSVIQNALITSKSIPLVSMSKRRASDSLYQTRSSVGDPPGKLVLQNENVDKTIRLSIKSYQSKMVEAHLPVSRHIDATSLFRQSPAEAKFMDKCSIAIQTEQISLGLLQNASNSLFDEPAAIDRFREGALRTPNLLEQADCSFLCHDNDCHQLLNEKDTFGTPFSKSQPVCPTSRVKEVHNSTTNRSRSVLSTDDFKLLPAGSPDAIMGIWLTDGTDHPIVQRRSLTGTKPGVCECNRVKVREYKGG